MHNVKHLMIFVPQTIEVLIVKQLLHHAAGMDRNMPALTQKLEQNVIIIVDHVLKLLLLQVVHWFLTNLI
jgi:hypothetical protein